MVHDPKHLSAPASLSRRPPAVGEDVISVLMAKTLAHPELISLAAGFVDHQTLPVEPTGAALAHIWSDPALARAALQYGTTIGYTPLREAVLDRTLQTDRVSADELNVSPAQVVLTAGSNQLLYLVSDVLLDPGDIVLCGSPSFSQVLMATVLQRDFYDAHLRRICTNYRAKLDAMLAAAEAFLSPLGVSWVCPSGGLYVWLRLPKTIETGFRGPLFDRAVEEGVLYVPGEHCFPADGYPRSKNSIRLSFGIQCCETIHRGVEALARVIGQVLV